MPSPKAAPVEPAAGTEDRRDAASEAADLVTALAANCTFPQPGTAVHCAVSGGADSSALMVLAVAAGCRVTAHHVDHQLRPGSAAEAHAVRRLADRFDADFVGHTVQVEPGSNLEARARHARFAVLPPNTMTGHTLDDRAETVLINLLRGAARTGLSPLSDPQRHPIVGLRRHETVALCEAHGIEFVQDPSNRDPRYVRNRVRHELMPLLDDIAARDVASVLDRQADVLGDEDAFLDELAAAIDPTDARQVAAAPVVLARRAVRTFIATTWNRPHPPGNDAVERVLMVANGSNRSCEIEGGHRVHRTHQKLRLEAPVASVKP